MQVNAKTRYLIQEMIRKNGWLEIPAEGTSMYPVIQDGDICRFVSCETQKLTKGDVVLFQDSTGRLITHRYVKAELKQDQWTYWFKGDTNLGFDEQVSETNIIGRLVLIKRGEKVLRPTKPPLLIWGKLITNFPLLSGLLRSYLNNRAPEKN